MSEYTSVYLREKAAALLSFRDNPTAEELEGKSQEEIQAIYQEVQTYNDTDLVVNYFILQLRPADD